MTFHGWISQYTVGAFVAGVVVGAAVTALVVAVA